MKDELVQKVKNDPNYKELVSKRRSFSIKLSVAVLAVYFTFILTIAFDPALLAAPISTGSIISIGIPIGIFVIIFAFVLTGVYTRRANSEFDELAAKIKDAAGEK